MVHLPFLLALSLAASKACIFTSTGVLVWFGDGWRSTDESRETIDRLLLGTGWQEFVVEADLSRLLAWFADGQDGTRCDWHVMWPTSGEIVRVAYVKVRHEGHWIVMGEVHPAALDVLPGWSARDLSWMI